MSFWKFIKGWIVYDFLFGHNDSSTPDSCCGDDDWYSRSENYGCGGSYDGNADWDCSPWGFDDDMSDDVR